MDNFKFQIQSLKSQIDNIKLQISNIEIQYNNMFGSNPSELLLNLSIQILNTGVQAFNTGKNEGIVSDNYYNQLKNISSLIKTILDEYQSKNTQQKMMQEMIQQQMMQQQMMQQQMMQQQMMQQQMMQQQMMQQQMMGQLNFENPEKINVTFVTSLGKKFNFATLKGTRIKVLLDKFSEKVGVPKNKFYFVFNGEKFECDDSRKIEEKLYYDACITAVYI